MNPLLTLWQYRDALFSGFAVTLELLALAAFIGTAAGSALAWLCGRFEGPLRQLVDFIAFAVSAIPALVILFWLYYPAQTLLGVSFSPFSTAAVALVLINSLAIYRIEADALREFPKQYIASALVSGLTTRQIMLHIQAPLLLRAALPRWIDQQVVVLQTSVFASLISVDEIFRAAQRINSVVYQPVLIYSSMAIVFFVAAGSAMYLAKYLRNRFQRDFSER